MNSFQRAIMPALAATLPLTLTACNNDGSPLETPIASIDAVTLADVRTGETMTTVTLLGFDSCPLTPLMKSRLETAITQLGQGVAFVQVDQQSLDPEDLRRGYPAPTVIVNGGDLFGMGPPSTPSMGCRLYAGPEGVPSVDDLTIRLHQVLAIASEIEGGER